MPLNNSGRPFSILLDWSFLKTSRFKFYAFSGTYSFESDGRVVNFNLEEAMRHPPKEHSIFRCDIIDEVIAEVQHETYEGITFNKGLSVGEYTKDDED
ncbi:hypothetical protein AHAS_Ahas11G0214300 [Arachis hypogaea]